MADATINPTGPSGQPWPYGQGVYGVWITQNGSSYAVVSPNPNDPSILYGTPPAVPKPRLNETPVPSGSNATLQTSGNAGSTATDADLNRKVVGKVGNISFANPG